MKSRIPITILFGLLLVATDETVVNQRKAIAEPTSKVSANSCVHVGRLVSSQGKVQLKRQTWSGYQPITIGTVLCQGDVLRPAQGTRAIVQCADPDQNLWTVPDGVSAGIESSCHPTNEPKYTISAPIVPTRDPLTNRIPYIISPNNTWLLSNKPTLRWQSVPGATVYVVRVSGPDVNWVREVSTTSIVYPGEPPLNSLTDDYLITVEADNGEAPAKATFSLLDPKNATRVQTAKERLDGQELTNDEKTLALAELYIGQGLIAEATELLEASVVGGSQTAAVYYTLGNLYTHLELFRKAEESFHQAVKLAKTAKDIEGQAATAARLGELYTVLGNSDKADYWLKQAKQGYEILLSSHPIAD